MSWPCFWTEPTGKAVLYFRRFTFKADDPCPESEQGHSASKRYAVRKLRLTPEGMIEALSVNRYRTRPEWPKKCDLCGKRFSKKAQWQVNQEPIYVRPDTGETWERRELPVGAMYHGWWSPKNWTGSDGIALHVILPRADGSPDHAWNVDGPATSGGHWTRTGDPKAVPTTVDANPSILTSEYHGYLRNGVLTDPV